jgi:hypothetical protein
MTYQLLLAIFAIFCHQIISFQTFFLILLVIIFDALDVAFYKDSKLFRKVSKT